MGANRRITVVILLVVITAGCTAGGDVGSTPSTGTQTSTTETGSTVTPAGTLEVHFINIGQSESILVVTPADETMLIDTGDFTDDGEYVIEYLQQQEIERIDHLVVSHADADHIGGNAAVIEYFETEGDGVGAVYDPGIAASTQTYGRYLDAVEQYEVPLYETREGDELPLAGATLDVLGPPDPYLENGARNENSIVLKLTFGTTSVLLTGDGEDDQEEYLVDTYGSHLQSTVLKAGHHGSKTSNSEAILDAVDPQVVVISSAYDSQFGHPNEVVLERFAARSIPTFWTATHGTVVVVSDGQEVTVRSQADAPTNPLSLREGASTEPGSTAPLADRLRITDERSSTVTPTETAVRTDGGSQALAVAEINADAEGNDNENLNDEYVVFENTGETPLDLGNYELLDEAGASYSFPAGFALGPGERVTVYTGSGTDTNAELYWGKSSAVWNNGGDTIIVRTDTGEEILSEEY